MRKSLFFRYLSVLSVVSVLSSGQLLASTNKVPEPFQGADENSELSIAYGDLTQILKTFVLHMDGSGDTKARLSRASTGTRFASNKSKKTDFEGNRFFYKVFEDPEAIEMLTRIRKSLEALPAEAPLSLFTNREQLAYWLNLYNVTVLEQVALAYPKRSLKKLITGKKSILDKKLLTVAGVPLSLNDIHHSILIPKFGKNPHVIYGLHQGYIGSPKLRKEAYTGYDVYRQLDSNAREFINSARGVGEVKKNRLEVSTYFQQNMDAFPNFPEDFKEHAIKYSRPHTKRKFAEAGKILPKIAVWKIADVSSKQRNYAGSSNTSSAALLDSVKATNFGNEGGAATTGNYTMSASLATKATPFTGRFTIDEVKILMEMKKRAGIGVGNVSVEEYVEEEKKDEEEDKSNN